MPRAQVAFPGIQFRLFQYAGQQQRIMQLLRVCGARPGRTAHLGYGHRVQSCQFPGQIRIGEIARRHGAGAPFFGGGIVEKCIGPRGQDLLRQRRRSGQIAHMHPGLTLFHGLQQRLEAGDIHDLVQAVVNGLIHQRVFGDLALAGEIVLAGQLIREDHGDEVLGIGALKLRRHALTTVVAPDGERDAGVPAPVSQEHGHGQHGLGHHIAHGI